MKRFNTLTVIVAITVFTLVSAQAFAQAVKNKTPVRPAVVAKNSDGVSDNFVRGRGLGLGRGFRAFFVDADGDGICDNFIAGQRRGLGIGTRVNFVDADGDGVCDNIGTRAGARLRDGGGRGLMSGLGVRNFIGRGGGRGGRGGRGGGRGLR